MTARCTIKVSADWSWRAQTKRILNEKYADSSVWNVSCILPTLTLTSYTPHCLHLHLSSSLCPSGWVAVGPVPWWIPIVRRSICEPYLILLICLQNKKKKRNKKKKKARKERRVEKHERRFLFLSGELTGWGQMNWKTWIMSWLSPSILFSEKSWNEMKQNSRFCWNLWWGTWDAACHHHCCYCVCSVV